jgi:hypothetical protein
MNVERAAVARASLRFLGYDANQFLPKTAEASLSVADHSSIGLNLLLSFRTTLHLADGKLLSERSPAIWTQIVA